MTFHFPRVALGLLPIVLAIFLSTAFASAVPLPHQSSSETLTILSAIQQPVLRILSATKIASLVRSHSTSDSIDHSTARDSADDDGDAPTTPTGTTSSSDNPLSDSINTTVTGQANDTSTDSTDQDGDSASTEDPALIAFQQFQLRMIETINDDTGDAFKYNTIFDNATLIGSFEGNPNISNIALLDKADNKSTWYTEITVRDRISFQFVFNTDLAYQISDPILKTTQNSGIEPQLVDFRTNADTGTGTFHIVYNCLMGKPGQAVISMHLPVTDEYSLDTTWVKDCGQGRFENMEFGFVNHMGKTVPFNADGTYGTEEKKTLDVGPIDQTTELVVKLSPPAETLRFQDPFVTSDSSVSLQIRGTVSAALFTSDLERKFTILHDCKGKASADVKFTIGIPPWDNVTATWRKDCGGSVSQALLIGTDGEDSIDVMQEGELMSPYDVDDDTNLENINADVTFLGPDVRSHKFFLTNSDDTSDIHFQTISTTMSNPDVMDVIVGKDGAVGLDAGGGILERNDMRTLLLYFACKKEGRSVVLVTLPTVRYANVEFGFVKECDGAAMVHYHSGFLQTAGSLLNVVLVLAIVAGVALCVCTMRKRTEGARYETVATSEVVA